MSGWYTDHCIGTIEIGTLQKGTNIVEATVPFTHRIGLEWCYLLGDFGVRIEGRAGVVTAPVRALSFGDIVPQGLPFMVEILPIICRYRSEQMALLYIFLIIAAHSLQ